MPVAEALEAPNKYQTLTLRGPQRPKLHFNLQFLLFPPLLTYICTFGYAKIRTPSEASSEVIATANSVDEIVAGACCIDGATHQRRVRN